MPIFRLTRAPGPELMDDPELPDAELRPALRFLGFCHRRFGGEAVILRELARWARRWDPRRELVFADIGAGAGDAALSILRWARRRGQRARVFAVERHPGALRVFRERLRGAAGVELIEADLLEWAPRERVDYAVASLVLHHVPEPLQPRALRALDRCSRRGLIVSDLERSAVAWAAVAALTGAFGDRVTRRDGPLSVRRGFLRGELQDLAAAAGLGYLRARRAWPGRLLLSGEKDA